MRSLSIEDTWIYLYLLLLFLLVFLSARPHWLMMHATGDWHNPLEWGRRLLLAALLLLTAGLLYVLLVYWFFGVYLIGLSGVFLYLLPLLGLAILMNVMESGTRTWYFMAIAVFILAIPPLGARSSSSTRRPLRPWGVTADPGRCILWTCTRAIW
jgi:hypothetical protein